MGDNTFSNEISTSYQIIEDHLQSSMFLQKGIDDVMLTYYNEALFMICINV